jgi:hypothetical protein
LAGIPSLVRVTADEVGSPKRLLLISTHQLFVGGQVAAFRSLDQITIGQWTALHLARFLHPPPVAGSECAVS